MSRNSKANEEEGRELSEREMGEKPGELSDGKLEKMAGGRANRNTYKPIFSRERA